MFTVVPRFQTASEEALGSGEDENVKPAGWAPQTLGVGSSAQLVRGLPDVFTYLCALETTVLGKETGVQSSSAWHGERLGAVWPAPMPRLTSCPWSFSILSPHGLPKVSRFSKLLNFRNADRYHPIWSQHCPWS